MDTGENSTTGQAAVVVPDDVAAAAAARNLGSVIDARKLANPFASAIIMVVLAAASFGLLALVANLVPRGTSGILLPLVRVVAVALCFGGVMFVALAARALVTGARSYFVYDHGFAYKHNGKVEAFGWADVTALKPVFATKGDNAGKLLHYNLVRQADKPVLIPLNIVNGRDPFLDSLLAILTRLGRPVN
jgi:hypothetical protein